MTLPGNVGDRLAHGDQAAVVARRASHLSEAGVLPHWHVMVAATVNERVKKSTRMGGRHFLFSSVYPAKLTATSATAIGRK